MRRILRQAIEAALMVVRFLVLALMVLLQHTLGGAEIHVEPSASPRG